MWRDRDATLLVAASRVPFPPLDVAVVISALGERVPFVVWSLTFLLLGVGCPSCARHFQWVGACWHAGVPAGETPLGVCCFAVDVRECGQEGTADLAFVRHWTLHGGPGL